MTLLTHVVIHIEVDVTPEADVPLAPNKAYSAAAESILNELVSRLHQDTFCLKRHGYNTYQKLMYLHS